jgi:hypothetical protein
MPITLGCTSCGKRFRARDESAGKRVKCPFCQSAVDVPAAGGAHQPAARTEEVPPAAAFAPPVPEPALPPPESAPVAATTPSDWGASEPAAPPKIFLEDEPFVPPPRNAKPLPPVEKKAPAVKPAATEKTPEQRAASAWRKARGGLFWVRFALCWLALVGLVPVGKMAFEKWGEPLPAGEGWVKIDGYVNAGNGTITLDKRDEIDLLAYGVPALLGGLALVFGRLTGGAAPRSSGAKGMFALSGLATLIALAGLATWTVCLRLAEPEISRYAVLAMVLGGGLAELWFLLALAAAGGSLLYPRAPRAVGFYVLLLGLGGLAVTVGWEEYHKHGWELGVPKVKDADWLLYEAGAKALGWLILVWAYWRSVGAVRRGIREFVTRANEGV